jgi:hypothetical protein
MSSITPAPASVAVPPSAATLPPVVQALTLNGSLKKDIFVKRVIDTIHAKLREIPDIEGHRLSPALTQLVCNLVENLFGYKSYRAKKYGVDKKEVVKSVLGRIYTLNADELASLDRDIEFIHSSKLIKFVPLTKLVGCYFLDWLKRRLL